MGVGAGPLSAFGRVFGDDVTCGVDSTKGWKTQVDVLVPDGSGEMILVSRDMITVRTNTLAALAADAVVTFQGTTYRVREVRRVGDGAFTQFWAAEV